MFRKQRHHVLPIFSNLHETQGRLCPIIQPITLRSQAYRSKSQVDFRILYFLHVYAAIWIATNKQTEILMQAEWDTASLYFRIESTHQNSVRVRLRRSDVCFNSSHKCAIESEI